MANKQKKVESVIAKMEKATNLVGSSPKIDEFLGPAKMAVGISLFAIGAYTATLLFRSPMMGKQSKDGKAHALKLSSVLTTINLNQQAIKFELRLDVPLMAQIRKAVHCPLPAESELEVEPKAKVDKVPPSGSVVQNSFQAGQETKEAEVKEATTKETNSEKGKVQEASSEVEPKAKHPKVDEQTLPSGFVVQDQDQGGESNEAVNKTEKTELPQANSEDDPRFSFFGDEEAQTEEQAVTEESKTQEAKTQEAKIG